MTRAIVVTDTSNGVGRAAADVRLLGSGSGHQAIVLENLGLRQQLAIYKGKKKRPVPCQN